MVEHSGDLIGQQDGDVIDDTPTTANRVAWPAPTCIIGSKHSHQEKYYCIFLASQPELVGKPVGSSWVPLYSSLRGAVNSICVPTACRTYCVPMVYGSIQCIFEGPCGCTRLKFRGNYSKDFSA